MPDYLAIHDVDPSFDALPAKTRAAIERSGIPYPDREDDCLTWRDLHDRMESIAATVPDTVRVAFRESSDWILLGAFEAASGRLTEHRVSLSLDPDRFLDVACEPAPETMLTLDVDADSLVDAIDTECGHEECDAAGDELRLPFTFPAPERALRALALAASRLSAGPVRLLVEAPRGALYVATLERATGAAFAPVYPWTEDALLRAWIRRVLPPVGAPMHLRVDAGGPATTARDAARPLTTGSARSRRDHAYSLRHQRPAGAGPLEMFSSAWPPAPGAYDALLGAVHAVENAGAEFAELRRELTKDLVAIDPGRAGGDLVAALETERDEGVRRGIFDLLSRLDSEAGHRAIVRGLTAEAAETREHIGRILGRHPRLIELTIRDVLAPAWSSDRALANRLLRLMDDEYLRVSRAVAGTLPPELVARLGPLVESG
jgi:hypothetical protein